MSLVWIVGDDYSPGVGVSPTVEKMKALGPIWGTPTSWRKCKTDNVVCTDVVETARLLKRAFHAVCNFYVPAALNAELGRPQGVKLFQGSIPAKFDQHSLSTVFHLVAPIATTVLVIGVSFATPEPKSEEATFQASLKRVFTHFADVQWVVLDHFTDVDPSFQGLPNVWFDTSANLDAPPATE